MVIDPRTADRGAHLIATGKGRRIHLHVGHMTEYIRGLDDGRVVGIYGTAWEEMFDGRQRDLGGVCWPVDGYTWEVGHE